jgi:hypothetical protein
MSVDGRYIAFFSFATNIGPPELANGSLSQAYVYDRETTETVQVSYGVGRVPADGASRRVTISPDGEWVAFASDATNLSTTPDLNARADLYLSRWRTGEVSAFPLRTMDPATSACLRGMRPSSSSPRAARGSQETSAAWICTCGIGRTTRSASPGWRRTRRWGPMGSGHPPVR